jgi:tetratricopeptide (TPR) repeat protein
MATKTEIEAGVRVIVPPHRRIERLVAMSDWATARRVIEKALGQTPDDHWLLSRLALTHYEQRRYGKALELERRALRIAPKCPLALWGVAGALQMLDRFNEAEDVYRQIIRTGATRLAAEPCGEGRRWARGLVADSWYRLAEIYRDTGDVNRAKAGYRRYLRLRAGGLSIYARRDAEERIRELSRKS